MHITKIALFMSLLICAACTIDTTGEDDPNINPIATGSGMCRTEIEMCGVHIWLDRGSMDVQNSNQTINPVYLEIEAVDSQDHAPLFVIYEGLVEAGDGFYNRPVDTEYDTVVEIDVMRTEAENDDWFTTDYYPTSHLCATSSTDWFCEVP